MREPNQQMEEHLEGNEQSLSLPLQKKRSWTDQEKRAIVEECRQPGATVSGIARKHGVPTNLLFQWRKMFEISPPLEKLSINEQMERDVRSTLSFIQECERIEQVLTGNLLADSRAKKISPYNASIALSNLVTSRERLINLSITLIERLEKMKPVQEEAQPEEDEIDLRFRRQMEMLCMQMADELYPPEKADSETK